MQLGSQVAVVDTAPIQPLAWELADYMVGSALKSKKKKKKEIQLKTKGDNTAHLIG